MSNWEAQFDAMWENSKGGMVNPEYLKAFIREVLKVQKKRILKDVKFIKKPELDNASFQLLNRHEREEYGRATLGYNEGVDDVIEILEP